MNYIDSAGILSAKFVVFFGYYVNQHNPRHLNLFR